MANNKSMVDQILEAKRAMAKQSCFADVGSLAFYPPQLPPLPKPTPEKLLPDQEEMDKLASALTEAVLQLRAGDMEGARATLSDANGLCGVQVRGTFPLPTDHYLDAARYGMGMSKQYMAQQPDGPPRTVTEQLMRQQIAERQMRQLMEEMNNNVNSTLYPPHILSDNTADSTDSGVT